MGECGRVVGVAKQNYPAISQIRNLHDAQVEIAKQLHHMAEMLDDPDSPLLGSDRAEVPFIQVNVKRTLMVCEANDGLGE